MKSNPSEPSVSNAATIRLGGFALILGALAFMGVFSYLAARFNYPQVLDGRASDVLPALLATGESGRAVWAVYSLLPLIWIPAGVGAFHALRARSEGPMLIGMVFAAVSAFAMMVGLMRWPSLHWELARAWSAAEPNTRVALEAVFNGTNRYLGNYIGEFLGELSINVFFLLSGAAVLRKDSGFGRWIGWLGVVTALSGLIGMFRNTVSSTAPLAAINNYLLPLWMIVFGVSLFRYTIRLPLIPRLARAAA